MIFVSIIANDSLLSRSCKKMNRSKQAQANGRSRKQVAIAHPDDLCIYNWLFMLTIIPTERWVQQCAMSRADEGAAFTCSWRDRLTGRETLWGNKGVPKTKEGHNQSQIPLRTSLPPIGAESPEVQVALSTNSVSVSRSVKLF